MYTVYIHKNKYNGKVYVGITSKAPAKRWRNGKGYIANKPFYNAILKYGWDSFEHIIVADGLDAEQAQELEKELIAEYMSDSPLYGYNLTAGGFGYNGFKKLPMWFNLPTYSDIKSNALLSELFENLLKLAMGNIEVAETVKVYDGDKLVCEKTKTYKTEPNALAIKAIISNYENEKDLKEVIDELKKQELELRKAIAKDNAFDLDLGG